MKAAITAILIACALSGAGCGRSEKKNEAKDASTPPPTLPADAETLQQAQMNAAAAHESASPTPAATP